MYLESDLQLFKKLKNIKVMMDGRGSKLMIPYELGTFNNYMVVISRGRTYKISEHMLKRLRERKAANPKDPLPEVFPYPFEMVGMGLIDTIEIKGNTTRGLQVVGLPEGDVLEIYQSVTSEDFVPATKDGTEPFIYEIDDVDHIVGEDNGYHLGALYYKFSPEDVNSLICYFKQ